MLEEEFYNTDHYFCFFSLWKTKQNNNKKNACRQGHFKHWSQSLNWCICGMFTEESGEIWRWCFLGSLFRETWKLFWHKKSLSREPLYRTQTCRIFLENWKQNKTTKKPTNKQKMWKQKLQSVYWKTLIVVHLQIFPLQAEEPTQIVFDYKKILMQTSSLAVVCACTNSISNYFR